MNTQHLHCLALLLLLFVGVTALSEEPAKWERSLWLNVSLAAPKLGYWGENFAPPKTPDAGEVANAARALIQQANPNRLYLIHHREMPFAKTAALFRAWRQACPASIEIIPALVLRRYDKAAAPVFSPRELDDLIAFFKSEINGASMAVYDVLPGRNQGDALEALARNYPRGLVRLGLQPDEPLAEPFTRAVEDTWSGFCHGLANADWQDLGFGRDTLRKWVALRNAEPKPIAYNLIVVAWDYANTKRGEYPGYDDANKNQPLPAERNRLAAREIVAQAKGESFAGFSIDLLIIELNSESAVHDGPGSFYAALRAGKPYTGFYAGPWREVCEIFQSLSVGIKP